MSKLYFYTIFFILKGESTIKYNPFNTINKN